MMLSGRELRALLQTLAAVQGRAQAARELAQALGVEELLLYVKDPVLDVMLPAPGMPKTQAGGPRWRDFLRRCMRELRLQATVDVPAGRDVPASAVARDGAALILLGTVQPGLLEEIGEEFPLLAALLVAQEALHIERAEGTRAREAAAQANDLALALDRARAASAELNLQLRHEHQLKDEFLAMLAHELRNPLSPLVNSIELLRRGGAGGDERTRRPLEVMSRQLQQLTRVVDDLLDVSRVTRGLIELRREPLLLAEVIEDAIEAARPLIDSRAHELVCGELPRDLVVHADRVRLTQVFVNLLSNAARYTDTGGRITLAVVVDQRRVSVVVQDNGIGIPQDMLSRVFDMFTQVSTAASRSQHGLGIGLTLARRLVELHGGRISAYSRGEGLGSTFTVSLPQAVAQGEPAPAKAPASASPTATTSVRPRVLVVDDNRDGAETLMALVACLGAEARVAHDGATAIELVPRFDPDLVLLDIGLPGMDGYETARRLRALPQLRARLVALTGYGAPQDRERALASGFDDHLVKPLSAEAAQGLLQQLAAMHAAS